MAGWTVALDFKNAITSWTAAAEKISATNPAFVLQRRWVQHTSPAAMPLKSSLCNLSFFHQKEINVYEFMHVLRHFWSHSEYMEGSVALVEPQCTFRRFCGSYGATGDLWTDRTHIWLSVALSEPQRAIWRLCGPDEATVYYRQTLKLIIENKLF